MILAVASLGILFVLLALVSFCVAVWLAFHQQWIGALVAAVVGVLILYVT